MATSSSSSRNFPFPFDPYPIQVDFMTALYETIEKKQIGIFESPTGTGKSLSLICGALKWLRDYELKPLKPELESNEPSESSAVASASEVQKPQTKEVSSQPDWMRDYDKKKKEREELNMLREHERILSRQKRRLANLRNQEKGTIVQLMQPASKRRKLNDTPTADSQKNNKSTSTEDDAEFLMQEYKSDDENADEFSSDSDEEGQRIKKKSTKKLSVYLGNDIKDDPDKVEEEEQSLKVRKVFYCSRTHSQLSQFVEEIKRTLFSKDVRMVTLASRKNLCIHPTVSQLPSANQINDKCLDMMQTKEKKPKKELSGVESKCEYLNHDLQPLLRDNALAKAYDIEELVEMGKSLKICPYYGARAATHSAELVVLPYQMILHKATRESLNIDLRGNVVLFDEAHNIIDTVTAIHSVEITGSKLLQAQAQLLQYHQRYQDRLKPKNKVYIQQILFFIRALIKYIMPEAKTNVDEAADVSQEPQAKIIGQNDFLFEAGIDNINLFKMEKFFQKSEIVKKVNGFCQAYQVEIQVSKHDKLSLQLESTEFEKHRPALGLVESFAMSLTNRNSDGRILVSKFDSPTAIKKSSIKFILLNPEYYFEEILLQARAVVLAGGTMQPFSDFTSQLVSPKIPPEKLRFLSCDHVIPDENLLGAVCEYGPAGTEFEFTYERRRDARMINDLGVLVVNICSAVPDGVVIFFPSYAYEEWVLDQWKASGVLQRIVAKKQLFREPRSTSSIDQTLQNYAKCIETNFEGSGATTKGAILSAVVGGKMSEGINFKDGLGRCVIMVGLPYPNAKDPVLLEKMAFINHKLKDEQKSSEYYDNLCMKAVNQSIGRTIRHAKDYGAILLVDRRFKRAAIQQKLPKWIQTRMRPTSKFGEVFTSVINFFKTKKDNQFELEKKRKIEHDGGQ